VVQIRDPNDANALGIGMVHQHFKLVDCFTVLDNIILGVEPCKLGFLQKKEAREKVVALSEKYGLFIDPDMKVEDITVGMQQRTEILKMLYRDNEILIFDEPTAVLTPQEIVELIKIMRNLAAEGKSILFISHKLAEIMAVSDRCTVLRKGKCVGSVNTAETTFEELSTMMVGRNVNFKVDKEDRESGEVILEVRNMTVASKSHKNNAVKNVSLKVRAGVIVCIAGIDGNGQTEFVHGLTGLEPLVNGRIFLNGEDISHDSIRKRTVDGISHIPEDRHKHGLVLDYSLEYNLVLQRYFEPQFTSIMGFLKRGEIRKYAEKLIDQYDIRSSQGPVTLARSMSGGNQQKIVLSRWLLANPKILIVDEPTRGIDVGAKFEIYQILRKLASTGIAIMVISSELPEIIGLSVKIVTFYKGSISMIIDSNDPNLEEKVGGGIMGINYNIPSKEVQQ
jgi:simple sugar transport system ATP-binding protein